jgi:deoxyribonuclease-4
LADKLRFGPAGLPVGFNGPLTLVPSYLKNEGLNAFEYQAVRWGVKPQVKRGLAEKFKSEALKNDVWVTMHGSYFINLAGDKSVVDKSIERIKACLEAADWFGAESVVFHPGFYGRSSSKEAFETCLKALNELVEYMNAMGSKAYLRPETTGKPSQLGSLDEILAMCQKFDSVYPTVDWAHIYARCGGCLHSKDDYFKVFEKIEKALGSRGVEKLHFHFTNVEYGDKGEIKHRTLDEPFGPDFKILAEVVVENGYKPVIISESPVLDLDAVKMKNIMEVLEWKKKK